MASLRGHSGNDRSGQSRIPRCGLSSDGKRTQSYAGFAGKPDQLVGKDDQRGIEQFLPFVLRLESCFGRDGPTQFGKIQLCRTGNDRLRDLRNIVQCSIPCVQTFCSILQSGDRHSGLPCECSAGMRCLCRCGSKIYWVFRQKIRRIWSNSYRSF